jgi:hypothetical protein
MNKALGKRGSVTFGIAIHSVAEFEPFPQKFSLSELNDLDRQL